MFPKSGFISIFKNATNETTKSYTIHEDLAAEWEINDCTDSESDQQENQQQLESSLLQIEHFSSDENTLKTNHFLNYPSNCYTTPARSKQPYKEIRSANKKPLPNIDVKRKSANDYCSMIAGAENSPRKVLSLKNSCINYQQPSTSICTNNLASPWRKMKNKFAPVRRYNTGVSEMIQESFQNEVDVRTSTQNVCESEKIVWSFSSSDSETTAHSSQNIEASSSQNATAPPTDLDLLIALIERQCNPDKKQPRKKQVKKRSYRKGGLVQELQQTLDTVITHAKYLETEKQLGFQSGIKLRILQLASSFGAHYAKVQVENDETKICHVVLFADMAERAKVGSTLEAFFDIGNMNEAYLGVTDEPIFLQPHNLLLL